MAEPYNQHADKLIVALDFEDPFTEQWNRMLEMTEQLAPLGVVLKVNCVSRLEGYANIASKIHSLGGKVFLDMKLNDIPHTLARDAALLREYGPEYVTVMCSAGLTGLKHFCKEIAPPNHYNAPCVVGVTLLSSLNEHECRRMYGKSRNEQTLVFADIAQDAGIQYLVMPAQGLEYLRTVQHLKDKFSYFMVGVRSEQDFVAGDDQQAPTTPQQAFARGASKIVVGRPIIRADDPVAKTKQYLDIIAQSV